MLSSIVLHDLQGVELGHHGQECSFEAILTEYNLAGDWALVLLGKSINTPLSPRADS